LEVSSDDADENPFNITITGVVNPLPSEIEIVDNWFQTIADGTGSVDFGYTPEGAAVTRTLTVYNWGTGLLTLDDESLELPDGYSLVGSVPTNIAANGGHATLTLRLVAATPGIYAGEFSIATNDADEGTYNFDLSGEVIEEHPEIEVRHSSGELLTSGAGSVEFGGTIVDEPLDVT